MARNPLTLLLQKAFADTTRQRQNAAHSRRRFLKNSTLAAAGLLIPPALKVAPFPKTPGAIAGGTAAGIVPGLTSPDQSVAGPSPRNVAIIGAGMAGLNAAYQLKRHGIPSTVFEASDRVGGRMFTLKDQFGTGITTDIGGEFVDSNHTDILQLAAELGLELYDLKKDTLIHKTFWFEGRLLGEKDLREAILPYTDQLLKDIHSLPPVISHATADSFRALDQLSILDYLRNIGISGWLFHFLDTVLTREYGMESAQQSAINFLIMFEPPTPAENDYELFGQDHEVFKIRGGSQHLSDKLYEQLKDQVRLQQKLLSIDQNNHGGYELHFEGEGGRGAVQADHVILTLPFTILRSLPFNIPMPAEKRRCIDEIGYGNSCKFIMGMDGKPWRTAGMQGYTFTDLSFGCGWDSSQSQSDKSGSFTVFGGGNFADWVRLNKEEDLTRKFLPALDTIYKGATTSYNGRNKKFCWAANPYSKAGYSAFKKGQWSTLAGWEGVPVGQVYFAGEHVSREFQGYMNGAAQTGRVAAEAVAAHITTSNKINN
ncbi:MAG TPA: NAD(P)/FAD-dependent oxidoreductase [Puia sp.]|nr:NAD(P)/FAD-dependent oxidoreductase [Puia sp.]